MLKKVAMALTSALCMGALLTGCGSGTQIPAETATSDIVASADATTETTAEASEEATQETTADNAVETAANGTAEITNADDQSLQSIIDKGQLVVGMSADYPPYEFHQLTNGKDEILGFDVQLANKIAEEIGVDLKIVDMNYDGLLMALKSGQIDMILSAMTPTEERKQSVDFSDIYFEAKQTMLVRVDDADKYNTKESIAEKKIGVQKGSLQEIILREQFPESRAISLTKIPALVMDLEKNKIEGIILEKAVADGYLDRYTTLAASTLPIEDTTGGTAVAMSKGSTALVAKVNEIIAKAQKDGTMDQFMQTAVEQSAVE